MGLSCETTRNKTIDVLPKYAKEVDNSDSFVILDRGKSTADWVNYYSWCIFIFFLIKLQYSHKIYIYILLGSKCLGLNI